MKKEIYRIFTTENGIRMSFETLNYINENYPSIISLESLLLSFKNKFNSNTIEINQIKNLSEVIEKPFFFLHSFKYKEIFYSSKFEIFKNKIDRKIIPISVINDYTNGDMTNDINNDSQSVGCIFGMFYRSKNGNFVIEDDHDVIEIDIKNCTDDFFLFENMFVAAQGFKNGQIFEVHSFILPRVSIYKGTNTFLEKKSTKICFFGCLSNQNDFLENVINKIKPEISLVSVNPNFKLEKKDFPGVVFVPSRKYETFLPSNLINNNMINTFNGGSLSNPGIIEVFNKKILFIDDNIYKNKENGFFINKNNLESFLNSFVSQYSANPFLKVDLSLDFMPNVIIISQDFYPFVMDISGIKVISLPSVSENAYAVLDCETLQAEISYN